MNCSKFKGNWPFLAYWITKCRTLHCMLSYKVVTLIGLQSLWLEQNDSVFLLNQKAEKNWKIQRISDFVCFTNVCFLLYFCAKITFFANIPCGHCLQLYISKLFCLGLFKTPTYPFALLIWKNISMLSNYSWVLVTLVFSKQKESISSYTFSIRHCFEIKKFGVVPTQF